MTETLERWYENYCADIRSTAQTLQLPMPALTEELFALFETTGNRLIYENVYFTRRKFLAILGLQCVLERSPDDLRRLETVLLDICTEECWALPAHVRRDADPDWRICVDLFAAETAQTLAELTTLLADELSPQVVQTVRRQVLRRVLDPFAASQPPYAPWENAASNWCAVCGGSVGSAALYLLQEQPAKLQGILARVTHALQTSYLQSFAADGACLEGLSYFTYGMTYFAGFARQLYEYTGGKTDLFGDKKLEKIAAFQAKCYFAGGQTVSFADSGTASTFRMGLSCFLAGRYPAAALPPIERAAGPHADGCYRWMGMYRDLVWTRAYIQMLRRQESGLTADCGGTAEKIAGSRNRTDTTGQPCGPLQTAARQTVLPDAQWVICQSENGAGMAAKGGHNAEPHNHNDIGSFLYLLDGEMLLADLGSGEYTRGYFGAERYSYLCCRSVGHNVPLINGNEQLPGPQYACGGFAADGQGQTVIRFAGAYDCPQLQSLTRTLDWGAADGTLRVTDCFSVCEPLPAITENLITQWQPVIEENRIVIQGTQHGCTVTVEGLAGKIACIPQTYSDHGGNSRPVWLLQWQVPAAAAGQQTARFTVRPL